MSLHLPNLIAVFSICLASVSSFAGSLGFNIQFKGEQVALQNIGSEAAYRLAVYSLTPDQAWQTLPTLSGDAHYLEPQKSITLQDKLTMKAGLSALGPLLIIFNDQSGGAMAHLAWRNTPPASTSLLRFERKGAQLTLFKPEIQASIARTWAIVVPYAGIEALAQPLQSIPKPSKPYRMDWQASTLPWQLNTGNGQSGAWLVHELSSGGMALQIVPDGKIRGNEQLPTWVAWFRANGLPASVVLGLMSGVVLLVGLWQLLRPRKQSLKGA
jgi:hypothetical protein